MIRVSVLRSVVLAWILALLATATASAEAQAKGFLGVTFGGHTTFFDPEKASGKSNPAVGASVTWLGQVFGVEGEISYGPGFFQRGQQKLVVDSSVLSGTASFVVAVPRKYSGYGLRPYAVAGGGFMHVALGQKVSALTVSKTLTAVSFGGGVTGFVTNRAGVSWDVRYFRGTGGPPAGVSFGTEKLSYWRISMGVAVRLGKVRP